MKTKSTPFILMTFLKRNVLLIFPLIHMIMSFAKGMQYPLLCELMESINISDASRPYHQMLFAFSVLHSYILGNHHSYAI